jgi:hypothetical protein
MDEWNIASSFHGWESRFRFLTVPINQEKETNISRDYSFNGQLDLKNCNVLKSVHDNGHLAALSIGENKLL